MHARFDRVAANWDANPRRIVLARAVVDAIRNTVSLRPDINAMEFGAGTGLVTLDLLVCVNGAQFECPFLVRRNVL